MAEVIILFLLLAFNVFVSICNTLLCFYFHKSQECTKSDEKLCYGCFSMSVIAVICDIAFIVEVL